MKLAPLAIALGLSANPAIAHSPNSTEPCEEVLIGDTNSQIEIDDPSCELLADLNIHILSINAQIWEVSGLDLNIPCLDNETNHTPEISKDFHLKFEILDPSQGTWILWMNNNHFRHSIRSKRTTVTHIDDTPLAEVCAQ